MNRQIYRKELKILESYSKSLPNSHFCLFGKVVGLSLLILRWEKLMLQKKLSKHPFYLAEEIIKDAKVWIKQVHAANEIAGGKKDNKFNGSLFWSMERYHQKLFQDLWIRFKTEDYQARIDQYIYRLKINRLVDLVKGKKCVDFGCGHGNFAQALKKVGATSVYGVDYGKQSIAFCRKITRRLGVANLHFKVASVYHSGFKKCSFDFAIQNGVFHHLEDEDRAYREVYRVLKPSGYFWVYTDGSNSIAGDIQDTASRILSNQPMSEVGKILDMMGLSVGKRYHLGDSLQATYRHTNYKKLTQRLENIGFSAVRRLKGGFPYDSDGQAQVDPWAEEKFGCGDLRILFQKAKT